MADEPFREITNANDVTLTVSGSIQVPVDSFELERAEDSGPVHGGGRREPRGYSKGNIEYNVDLSVEGDVVDLMDAVREDADRGESAEISITATSPHYKWRLRGVILNEDSYSYDDGDPVTYDASGFAMRLDTESQGGTDA